MNQVDDEGDIDEIKRKAEKYCCDGYVYYDGRCGDDSIFIHEKSCKVGKKEQRMWDYWNRGRR